MGCALSSQLFSLWQSPHSACKICPKGLPHRHHVVQLVPSPASPAGVPRGHKKAHQNHQNHATPCKIKQNRVMSSNAKKIVQNELFLRSVHTCTPCSNARGECAAHQKKLDLLSRADGQFDGHCYMYRAVKRWRGRRRVLHRGKARRPCRPSKSVFWCENLQEARRQLMAVGEAPRWPQYCGQRLRRGTRSKGGARGAAEVVRGAQPKVQGPAPPAWRTRC